MSNSRSSKRRIHATTSGILASSNKRDGDTALKIYNLFRQWTGLADHTREQMLEKLQQCKDEINEKVVNKSIRDKALAKFDEMMKIMAKPLEESNQLTSDRWVIMRMHELEGEKFPLRVDFPNQLSGTDIFEWISSRIAAKDPQYAPYKHFDGYPHIEPKEDAIDSAEAKCEASRAELEKHLTTAGSPITYRMLHEDAAGMGLEDGFFKLLNVDPDAPVKCNCKFEGGHEPQCDIVFANKIIEKKRTQQS